MSNWISVKDRLPDFKALVLAVDIYGDIGIGYFCKGYQDKLRCVGLGISLGNVTHWQLLPAPPAEGE